MGKKGQRCDSWLRLKRRLGNVVEQCWKEGGGCGKWEDGNRERVRQQSGSVRRELLLGDMGG